ncbi:MAG: hypothetical protein MUO26_10025 [Methanotrichaceae archaeon]|nr:hypothetical protein [Methanotrichaceae archaeon]
MNRTIFIALIALRLMAWDSDASDEEISQFAAGVIAALLDPQMYAGNASVSNDTLIITANFSSNSPWDAEIIGNSIAKMAQHLTQ